MLNDAYVDRYGTPGGHLVIALHGAVANRKTWLALSRALPPHFELWCPDLPGHGSRRDEVFARASALETIGALVAHARPRRVVLAGDSLGGYLALEAAATMPHGIEGVVAGGCTWSMTGLGGVLARLTDVPVRALEAIAGGERLDRWFASAVPLLANARDTRAIVACGLRVRSRSESLTELRGLDLVRVVREVRAPITFVNGANDWPTRAGEGQLLAAARSANRMIAPGVGHGVGILAPAVFARAVVSLIGPEYVADRRASRSG